MARKRTRLLPLPQGLDLSWIGVALGYLIGEATWKAPVLPVDPESPGDSSVVSLRGFEIASGLHRSAGALPVKETVPDTVADPFWNDLDSANSFDWSAFSDHRATPAGFLESLEGPILPIWSSGDAGVGDADFAAMEYPAWDFDGSEAPIMDVSLPLGLPVVDFT